MKLRPLLILLLFVVSAGVLVWIYYSATHTHRSEKVSPWADTLSDLDACCRRKHVKSVQYNHFAAIADSEQRQGTGRLFRSMALSERLQEHNCANAIVRLGGSYTPPAKVVVFRGTTDNNLERSIANERQSLGTLQRAEIDRAMDKGNRYAARTLIWATAGDLRHLALMEYCLHGQPANDPHSYVVCPGCGNIYNAAYCDPYCPFCLTGDDAFIRFE